EYRPKPDEVIWISKFAERKDRLAEGPGDGAYGMPNHPGITLAPLRRLQGLTVRLKASGFQGIRGLKRARKVLPVTYRVYRHSERITARNIHRARRLAEVGPLSGYDGEVYAIHFQGEYINQREEPNSVIPTLCVDKGKALNPGEGLYVHTTAEVGRYYYAVTTAVAGTENLRDITDANSLSEPVPETPGTPEPVLQWVQEDRYHKDPPEYWYRYWAAPPYCNLPSRSFRVAVAVSEKFKPPGPLDISTISGAFNVRGSIRLPRTDRVVLLVKRQLDWLPALFYNEGRGTLRGMTESKVDYFSERYMSFMIKWIMGRHEIDRSRISGSLLHFGLRHPEIFTRMWFGSYTAGYDLRWAPGGPSMPGVLGPKGIKTTSGEDAWKMYSVGEYVSAYPDRDIPFLVCNSGTGKDSGHTSEFGWQDDPRGWRGLIEGRQPFVASWSCGLPRELGAAFAKMRWDVSIPAFGNCSLDNNPGNGDPADGDYYGCINGWLLWSDAEQTDQQDKWEMLVWVLQSAPADECTVDITPRHCKARRPSGPVGQRHRRPMGPGHPERRPRHQGPKPHHHLEVESSRKETPNAHTPAWRSGRNWPKGSPFGVVDVVSSPPPLRVARRRLASARVRGEDQDFPQDRPGQEDQDPHRRLRIPHREARPRHAADPRLPAPPAGEPVAAVPRIQPQPQALPQRPPAARKLHPAARGRHEVQPCRGAGEGHRPRQPRPGPVAEQGLLGRAHRHHGPVRPDRPAQLRPRQTHARGHQLSGRPRHETDADEDALHPHPVHPAGLPQGPGGGGEQDAEHPQGRRPRFPHRPVPDLRDGLLLRRQDGPDHGLAAPALVRGHRADLQRPSRRPDAVRQAAQERPDAADARDGR
ncbi:MAG: hypothetical protein ACYS5V_17255, partial [Planctomycetota bacterium]